MNVKSILMCKCPGSIHMCTLDVVLSSGPLDHQQYILQNLHRSTGFLAFPLPSLKRSNLVSVIDEFPIWMVWSCSLFLHFTPDLRHKECSINEKVRYLPSPAAP